MIHPTRTNLLLLKDKISSVYNSIGILKARRQALIKEFMTGTTPAIKSRDEISKAYEEALLEYKICKAKEGENILSSIEEASKREFKINISRDSIWGLPFKNVSTDESAKRKSGKRGYENRFHSLSVDSASAIFEKIIDSLVELATHEKKLKKLADEITKTTRRVRVLEEKVIPEIKTDIKFIVQYFSERDRESFYRLKMFKRKKKPQDTA